MNAAAEFKQNGKPTEHTNLGIPSVKIVLWVLLVSFFMVFAGLTSAYMVRQAEGNWLEFDLPSWFWVSTVCIVLSSVSMILAGKSAGIDKTNLVRYLFISFLLGLGFVLFQFLGWMELVDNKIFVVGNPSGSFVYVLTGLHVAHVLGGLIYLFVVLLRAQKGKYVKGNTLQIELASTYWHFVDLLWIYLFAFLLIVR